MITVKFNRQQVDVEYFQFSAGEMFVEIKNLISEAEIATVNADIKSSNDLMVLFQTLDIVKGTKPKKFYLYLPYLPYSRQDRKMTKGQSFALKLLADRLNSFKLDGIFTLDAHSGMSEALIDNLYVDTQLDVLKSNRHLKDKFKNSVVIAPDTGASKKAFEIAKNYNRPFVQATKVRSVETGEITHTEVYGDVKGKECVIFDDICDGGFTFIKLSEVLKEKGASRVDLVVSHGIFSKGLEPLMEVIDKVYVINPFNPVETYTRFYTNCRIEKLTY